MFSFKYKVGLPFWKFFVRHGAHAKVYVQVIWDDEAKVFVAHNSNLRGLVTSAPTIKELLFNINEAAIILLEDAIKRPIPTQPDTRPLLTDQGCPAC